MPQKILIAEDDPVSSQLLQMAMEELGFDVVSACDGEEAWSMFQEASTPIVVSDWDMPNMDGITLCKHIRDMKLPTYTYFILLTAKSSTTEIQEAMDAGVDDFLTKPLIKQELYSRIRVAQRIRSYTEDIAALKRVIPICSYCKKIRRDGSAWQKLEIFLEHNLNRDISHSICPDCFQAHIEPQFREMEERKRRESMENKPLIPPPEDDYASS